MAIRISKPAINLKDKLSQLDRPVGTTGARLLATSTSDEVFSLLTAGNVGIGTSPAVAKLQVTTTSNTGNVFTWSNGQFLISPGGTATSQGLGFSVNTADASASLSSLTPGSSWNTMRYRAVTHVFMEGDTTRLIITNTGNVGIATTNPGTTLDVNGSIRSNTQVNVNNSSSFYIPYAAGDTGAGTDEKYWRIAQLDRTNKTLSLGVAQNDGSTEAYSSIGIIRSSARISKISLFTDNNQERLSVDISGRISAGLALGSYTSYVTPRLLVNCESTGSGDASSVIIGESGSGTAHPTISFHRRTGVTVNQTYGYRLVEFLGDLQFQSAPAQLPGGHIWTERVTFTAGGNVGIGTTNPAEKFVLSSSGTLARFASTGTYGDIAFTNTFGGGTVHYIGCYDTSLRFFANSGSVPTMTISGGAPGNVGIGATNPTEKLEVNGNLKVFLDGINQKNVARIVELGYSGITGAKNWALRGTYQYASGVSINADGGDLDLIKSLDRNTVLATKTDGSTLGKVLIGVATESGTQLLQVAGGAYLTGNVGIGTTNPTQKLHAFGTGDVSAIFKSTSAGAEISLDATNGYAALRIFASGTETWRIGNVGQSSSFQIHQLGGGDRLNITSSGNVGIGITNPTAYKFQVSGDIKTSQALHFGTGGTYEAGTIYSDSNWGVIIRGLQSSPAIAEFLLTNSADVQRLRIDTSGNVIIPGGYTATGTASQPLQVTGGAYISGNVGIGTTNPQRRLHVHAPGTDLSVIRLSGTAATQTEYDIRQGIVNVSNGGFSIYDVTSAATRFAIAGAGNVGIGTDNPSYKLHVVGSFAATTKSFVIDHPTKENYKLRHGSLEGPENGVYVRGRTQINIIELPEYWTGLVDENSITVNLTPIGNINVWVEDVIDNKVYINSNDTINCFYIIFGERKDVEKLEVEFECQ